MCRRANILAEVFGQEGRFEALEDVNQILGSIMRHWNFIAGMLQQGDAYAPILLEDANGVSQGSDWARGFMRGVDMRRGSWAELIADEEHFGALLPVLMLFHEHDEEPELRPNPIAPEKREEIIVGMAAGLVRAYRYFKKLRAVPAVHASPRRNAGKVGRNDRCPCGSGKKYKRCCGGVTVH